MSISMNFILNAPKGKTLVTFIHENDVVQLALWKYHSVNWWKKPSET